MDEFQKGKAKLKKAEEEHASSYKRKPCSGKDIYGEEIYLETANTCDCPMNLDRFRPIKPSLDPLAYLIKVAELKKKALANKMNTEKGNMFSDSPQKIKVDTWNEGESSSPQEISDDAWNEGQSARKRAKYEGEACNRRHKWLLSANFVLRIYSLE